MSKPPSRPSSSSKGSRPPSSSSKAGGGSRPTSSSSKAGGGSRPTSSSSKAGTGSRPPSSGSKAGSRAPSAQTSRPTSAAKTPAGSRPSSARAASSATKPAKPASPAAGAGGGKGGKKKVRPPVPWLEVLGGASESPLWGGKMAMREAREKWKLLLTEQVKETLAQPRTPLPEDVVEVVLNGDLGDLDISKIPNVRNKVVIFVSSTFTDTKAERNTLMRDVYPYLRTLCRSLGLDFGSVDMRWGVNEESTFEHETTDMCIREVRRCVRESAGPAFLCILSHKYGFRPFPNEIEQEQYELLLKTVEESGSDTDTAVLREWFKYDENALPPKYVMKPRTAEDTDWWSLFGRMQTQLREAAAACLAPEEAELYRVSVTEREVAAGVFENPAREEQVVLLQRTLADVAGEKHRHRHILDVQDGEVDDDAQKHLQELREVKVIESLPAEQVLTATYDETDESSVKRYIRAVCDDICERLSRGILDNYLRHLHVERDDVFQEALIHRATALDKCALFVGRETLIERVVGSVRPDNRRVFALHGRSGCGKTALMAVCARGIRERHPSATLVLRFLGTTSASGSARALLASVCAQITRSYARNARRVPEEYKKLCEYFRECLGFATEERPLVVVLDSLDQLSNEDFGRNLAWLPVKEELPPHCHLVVSTLPNQCLDILAAVLPADECTLEVRPLEADDAPPILEKMLAASGRTVSGPQRQLILDAFAGCPLPLYLRLCADIAVKWRSYDEVSAGDIAPDMPGMITLLFLRLEARYGRTFVHHALAYLTAAKNGLSVAELEDVLSCDDDTLNEIFTFWMPPFRRIPPLLWLRVRNDLGMYLVERGTDGVNAYGWYHRQFWETAQARYLDASPTDEKGEKEKEGQQEQGEEEEEQEQQEPFEPLARLAIADYFEGKYYSGKEYTLPETSKFYKNDKPVMESRQLPSQPLIVAGDRTSDRVYNRRKLRELSHQLLRLEDWERFEREACSLEFIEAKFAVSQGYECVAEFIEATKHTDNTTIKAMSKFVGAHLGHLVAEADGVYQLASQQVASNVVRQMYDKMAAEELPRDVTRDQDPSDVEDPCEMTLRGHTSGVRVCRYSPGGDMICSTSEDGSLRLWDAFSGAEVVTVTGLPGPTYPSLADPYHGERPCAFSVDGKLVATGSEDGVIQLWDLTGAEVHRNEDHTDAITGVAFSPDGSTFATCSKDKSVRFWDAETCASKGETILGGQGLGCEYSPDGARLAVATYGGPGMTMIDTGSYVITSAHEGHTNLNLCVAYSPLGDVIATAGDNSSISMWKASTGETYSLLKSHKGWIWCVTFSPDGSKLLSCSSDRSLKMWDVENEEVLVTLGGHLHRWSWVAFSPGKADKFITCSLDQCIKVWDFEAVQSGHVPKTGGLHYNTLLASPDGAYVATSQGWSNWCSVVTADGDSIGEGARHDHFLEQAAWCQDSRRMISVDTGHGGEYTKGAVVKAECKIKHIIDGWTKDLDVQSGCTVAGSDTVLCVGTADSTIEFFCASEYQKLATWSFTSEGAEIDTEEKHIVRVDTSGDGRHVVAVAGKYAKILDVSTPSEPKYVTELGPHDALMKEVKFSPSGHHLVTATITGSLKVWDAAADFAHLCDIEGHSSLIKVIAFSPDGAHFASADVGMTLKVWEVSEGYRLKTVWYGPVNQLGFTANNVIAIGEATGLQRRLEF